MRADRADFRRLFAHHEVAADAALPHHFLALLEDLLHLDVFEELEEPRLVGLFNRANGTELVGERGEAVGLGLLRKGLVHVAPLVVLALGRCLEVFRRRADAVVQMLEPELRMLLLVFRRFLKDLGDLLEAFLAGDGRKVRVLVAGHGLAGEGGFEVLFGLGAGEFRLGHSGSRR